MKRLIVLLAVIASSAAHAADTDLKLFHPAILQASNHQKIVGECSAHSALVSRENAWQCQANNQQYDPCFILPMNPLQANCIHPSASKQTIVVSLKKAPLNQPFKLLDMSQTLPFIVRLESGARCWLQSKRTVINGLPVHYQCNDRTLLLGHLQRCNPKWTMIHYQSPDNFHTAVVTKAWF